MSHTMNMFQSLSGNLRVPADDKTASTFNDAVVSIPFREFEGSGIQPVWQMVVID